MKNQEINDNIGIESRHLFIRFFVLFVCVYLPTLPKIWFLVRDIVITVDGWRIIFIISCCQQRSIMMMNWIEFKRITHIIGNQFTISITSTHYHFFLFFCFLFLVFLRSMANVLIFEYLNLNLHWCVYVCVDYIHKFTPAIVIIDLDGWKNLNALIYLLLLY